MCVHETGPCELRTCKPPDPTQACTLYATPLCDCEEGYLFDSNQGTCVKSKQCSQNNNTTSGNSDTLSSQTCTPKKCEGA